MVHERGRELFRKFRAIRLIPIRRDGTVDDEALRRLQRENNPMVAKERKPGHGTGALKSIQHLRRQLWGILNPGQQDPHDTQPPEN